MAYKKLIKVSNVCQLLDKSKYPATKTIYGVTFTNNGDGTITLDGTGNTYSVYRDLLFGTLNETHKYLFTAASQQCAWGQTYGITCTNSSVGFDSGNGKIFTNAKRLHLVVYVWKQNSVSNLVFKPQLFDLTEMYGAGHEPTSVEEFRQDFPEEMYDYSPHCWLTSYKRVFMTGSGNYLTSYQRNLTCKTKNLFDINSVTEVRHIRTGLLKPTTKWSIKNNSFITTLNNYSDGVSYILPTLSLEPGIYTFSAFCTSDYKLCWFGIYDFTKSEGFDEYYTTSKQLSKTFEITEKSEIGLIMQGYSKNFIGTFSNIQLELGSTATDYVPYGHL